MKVSLPVKLGILVIALFGAVVIGLFLYQPLRTKYHASRLTSENFDIRHDAAWKLARLGGKIMPDVRKWLASDDDRLSRSALFILEFMDASSEYDARPQALPEIALILDGPPSEKTDGAAHVAQMLVLDFENEWKDYPARLRNIYRFNLLSERAFPWIVNERDLRPYFAGALAETGDPWAVVILSKALLKYAPSEQDEGEDICGSVLDALMFFDNECSVEPIMRFLETSQIEWLRAVAFVVLAQFETPEVKKYLAAEARKGDMPAALAGYWQNGKYFYEFGDYEPEAESEEMFYWCAKVKWGDWEAFEEEKEHLIHPEDHRRYYLKDIVARLPDGFPHLTGSSEDNSEAIFIWMEENGSRAHWNPVAKKYYLEPEEGKEEKSE